MPRKVFGRAAFIPRTDRADGEPESGKVIEVACELKLRERHGLRDGNRVEVEAAD